jgi:hypothetical protein
MSLITDSTEFLQTILLPYGQDLCPGPRSNQELLGDQAGGSTLDVAVGNDQGRTALGRGDEVPLPSYFDYHTPAMFTASPDRVQFVPQSNLPPYEVGAARLPVIRVHPNVSQTQPRGTKEHVYIQSARGRGKRTSTRPKVKPRKPWCVECNKELARTQEFKRHLKEVHGPPRQCPLCGFKWIRPDKINAHIVANHQDEFIPEMLDHIKSLRGRQIVAFVDGIAGPYGRDLDINAATFHPPITQGSSLF